MATRLLLTLLALLTGLAAQLAPAQARMRAEGASAVGVLAAAVEHERNARIRLGVPVRPQHRPSLRDRCTVAVMHDQVDCAPSVMLGIDRARE